MLKKAKGPIWSKLILVITISLFILINWTGATYAGPSFTLDPSKTALIVVDMQNDFCREGAVAEVPDARKTINNHQDLIKICREKGIPIIYTKFVTAPEKTS